MSMFARPSLFRGGPSTLFQQVTYPWQDPSMAGLTALIDQYATEGVGFARGRSPGRSSSQEAVSRRAEPPPMTGRAYEKAPDTLMGFPRNRQGKSYEAQRYKFSQPVKVIFPDGTIHFDEVKGLNKKHALARARRNWPDAASIDYATPEELAAGIVGSDFSNMLMQRYMDRVK